LASVAVSEKLHWSRPEPSGQLGSDPLGVLGGQHRREPAGVLDPALHDGCDNRAGGVPSHRAGVAEREVDVLVPVDVPDPAAAAALEVDREAAAFLFIHVIGTRPKR
jgi:hypothetical protein